MKNYLIIVAVMLVSGNIFGQNDQWINRIHFLPTTNCPDSIHCYHNVVIDVNLRTVADSASLWFKIGSSALADDIYSKHCYNTAVLRQQAGAIETESGVARFSLGSYLITDENFFVDLFIE